MAAERGSHCCCWACVPQSTVGIVEKFGSYEDIIPPGMSYIGCACCGPTLRGTISLRTKLLRVHTRSSTSDSVIVDFYTTVMFHVIPSECHTAFYALQSLTQISSYVDDSVRGEIARIPFENIFSSNQRISAEVKKLVYPELAQRGFEVDEVLVAQIAVPPQVVQASEAKLENYYLRIGNGYRAEMNKIMVTIKAEADAEVKRLSGVGAAAMQMQTMGGMGALLAEWEKVKNDNSPHGRTEQSMLIAQLLMQQWLDQMKSIGGEKTHAVMMPGQLGFKMV
jgi:regulator of protease activity HflC (stomatin/prohibitin superfamily)